MQRPGRKCFYGFLVTALVYIVLCGLGLQITKSADGSELLENQQWIATSKYWLDRQMCRWLGLCGTMHLNSNGWVQPHPDDDMPDEPTVDFRDFWQSGEEDPDSWTDEEVKRREIPQYVLDHAPYIHLFSGEQFWPCDIAEHLVHTSPFINYTNITDLESDRDLSNLAELNDFKDGQHGRYMYLQSKDNVEENPEWLVGAGNIPDLPGRPGPIPDFPSPDMPGTWSAEAEGDAQQMLNEQIPLPVIEDDAPSDRVPSPDGRCGGSSGFTCTGSRFGQCCSIYGWCGSGAEYCADSCNPLAGTCYDPRNPPRGPHPDLRRRQLDTPDSTPRKPQPGGKSAAPAILIVVPKEDGIVDAFWFCFYSYNLGQRVLNIRFGNHVGDWEHTMIRFRHGQPTNIFLSEHNFGHAYTWRAVEKYIPSHDGSGTMIGSWSNSTASKHAKRPVVYSAIGSHAMYGTPGLHPYVLPFGLLHDETDRGPLWDPSLNMKAFTYDVRKQNLRSSTLNPKSPTNWFHFAGHWGDKYYPLSDRRQYRFAGQYHYVNGPTGPKFKHLGRKEVCQGRGVCHVSHWLGGDENQPSQLPPEEGEEEGGLPGGNFTEEVWCLPGSRVHCT